MTAPAAWHAPESDSYAETLIRRGLSVQLDVGRRLLDEGLAVRVGQWVDPPPGVRNIDAAQRLSDEPDIVVTRELRIEVKERGFAFTGPGDYPYDTAMIGDLRSWRVLRRLPVAVVLVSAKTSGVMAVAIPRSGLAGLLIESRHDSQRGIDVESVAAPRRLYRTWGQLTSWLANQ